MMRGGGDIYDVLRRRIRGSIECCIERCRYLGHFGDVFVQGQRGTASRRTRRGRRG